MWTLHPAVAGSQLFPGNLLVVVLQYAHQLPWRCGVLDDKTTIWYRLKLFVGLNSLGFGSSDLICFPHIKGFPPPGIILSGIRAAMTSMNRLRTWRIWWLDHLAPAMISDFVQVIVRVGSVFIASHSRRAREYGLDCPISLLFCPADLRYYVLRHFWDWTGRKLLQNTVERAGASELMSCGLLYSWLFEVVESWLSAWQKHITATCMLSHDWMRARWPRPRDHD